VPPVWEEWPRGRAAQEGAQFEPDLAPGPAGPEPLSPEPEPSIFESDGPPPALRSREGPETWTDPAWEEMRRVREEVQPPWDDPFWDPDDGKPGW